MEPDTPCHEDTLRDKRSPYEQYYFGQKNKLHQRNGDGENHWSGPESLEWYTGSFVQDTMHGEGEYRWRYKDPDGAFVTYEGKFYANKMHGYGVMSYPDGKVFTGLYYNNVRWGPGIEHSTSLESNVGLWRGTQLARLSWAPPPRSVAPDLSTGPEGPAFLNRFRRVFIEHVQTIGETNSAIDLLKEIGRDPVTAHIIWPKLYPMTCNDPESALFHKNLFDYKYYRNYKYSLVDRSAHSTAERQDSQTNNVAEYYAWNNDDMIVHMMKHAFQHDKQRGKVQLSLKNVLNGPRKRFRPAGKHEMNCRTVLMASYLGYVDNVAQLVNEADVYADIADMRGNTALMYAVCGNQTKIVGFLLDAGANVNSCNDSCCTPLGVALLRYISVANDIGNNKLLHAILPHVDKEALKAAAALAKTTPSVGVMEWYIARDPLQANQGPGSSKRESVPGIKLKRGGSSRSSLARKRSDSIFKSKDYERTYDSDDKIGAEYKMAAIFMKGQYSKGVTELYQPIHGQPDPEYIFAVNENFLATDSAIKSAGMVGAQTKPANLDPMKSQLLWENHMLDGSSLDSAAKHKIDMLSEIQLTIMDLLAHGANPKLVICPQPAVLLALKTRNPDIVKHMVTYGADINQQFPELNNFTVLDMVVTDEYIGPENLEMMRALLKLGADTSHRVPVPMHSSISPSLASNERKPPEEGPTLLHIVLMKKCQYEGEDEIIEKMIQLLISYHCDPTAHYKGSSAIETTMMFKFHLLHIFIKNPKTNLNGIINSRNQTILMKLFSKDFFREITQAEMIPTLTNLLLYGADPLLEGQDGEKLYGNVFEFATKNYKEMRLIVLAKFAKQAESKPTGKQAKNPKKSIVSNATPKPKGVEAESIEYKESLDLMTECARLLHIRWIQGRLARELIDNIYKYNYRPWSTIIRGYDNGYILGLWLTTLRSLEIWDILKTSRRKKYKDPEILRKYVSIVQFYTKRVRAKIDVKTRLTAAEANIIDSDVRFLLEEHRISTKLSTEAAAWKMLYVKPELDTDGEHKFHVCFHCALRLKVKYITCDFCSQVSFCNLECLKENIEKGANHPCNDFLAEKYLPLPEAMSLDSDDF